MVLPCIIFLVSFIFFVTCSRKNLPAASEGLVTDSDSEQTCLFSSVSLTSVLEAYPGTSEALLTGSEVIQLPLRLFQCV